MNEQTRIGDLLDGVWSSSERRFGTARAVWLDQTRERMGISTEKRKIGRKSRRVRVFRAADRVIGPLP